MDKVSINLTARSGRPRDPGIDEAVFAEVLRLVTDEGIGAISRRRVATGAGVSRQTLYNRWPTVGDMVLDALLDGARRSIGTTEPVGDLRAYLRDFAEAINGWAAPGLRAVVALAQSDPEFAARFRDRFLEQRHRALTEQVRASMGEHATAGRAELSAELIAGSMWYRVLVADLPLDGAWIDRMAGLVDRAAARCEP